MPVSTGDPWLDWLRDLLCKIYKHWGGDCATDFPPLPTSWVQKVTSTYAAQGAPVFTSPLAKQLFVDLLNALESHLKLADNGLSAADTNLLNAMIAGLRFDLGI